MLKWIFSGVIHLSGIMVGLAFAFYYFAKRYYRKFEKAAREMKDEDLNGDNKK